MLTGEQKSKLGARKDSHPLDILTTKKKHHYFKLGVENDL